MFASLACAGCRCGGSKAVPEANAMADASPDAAVEAGRPARMDHGAGIVVERIPIAFEPAVPISDRTLTLVRIDPLR